MLRTKSLLYSCDSNNTKQQQKKEKKGFSSTTELKLRFAGHHTVPGAFQAAMVKQDNGRDGRSGR
jgi:hypothetical protein